MHICPATVEICSLIPQPKRYPYHYHLTQKLRLKTTEITEITEIIFRLNIHALSGRYEE
jgi:hypothetical protein